MNNTQQIIVYRSHQEQLTDEFFQEHPGVVLAFVGLFGVLFIGVLLKILLFKPRNYFK